MPLTLALFQNFFRGPDLIILLVLVLLIFAPRLPALGKSLGRGVVEFRKGLKGKDDDSDRDEAG